MKPAVAYIRVSTTGQAEDSPVMQQNAINAWAEANDYLVVATFLEVQSGKNMEDRPQLLKAMAEAARGNSTLIAYSLSRLARSVGHCYEIASAVKQRLACVRDALDFGTPVGRLLFGTLAVFAQFERDIISQRTSDGIQSIKKRGRRWTGKNPYGVAWSKDGTFTMRKDGTLRENSIAIPVPEELEVLAMVRGLASIGMNTSEIAATLRYHGHTTRKGDPWDARRVWDLCAAAKIQVKLTKDPRCCVKQS